MIQQEKPNTVVFNDRLFSHFQKPNRFRSRKPPRNPRTATHSRKNYIEKSPFTFFRKDPRTSSPLFVTKSKFIAQSKRPGSNSSLEANVSNCCWKQFINLKDTKSDSSILIAKNMNLTDQKPPICRPCRFTRVNKNPCHCEPLQKKDSKRTFLNQDMYGSILGPTPDEAILAGLQTVIEMCSSGKNPLTCRSNKNDNSQILNWVNSQYVLLDREITSNASKCSIVNIEKRKENLQGIEELIRKNCELETRLNNESKPTENLSKVCLCSSSDEDKMPSSVYCRTSTSNLQSCPTFKSVSVSGPDFSSEKLGKFSRISNICLCDITSSETQNSSSKCKDTFTKTQNLLEITSNSETDVTEVSTNKSSPRESEESTQSSCEETRASSVVSVETPSCKCTDKYVQTSGDYETSRSAQTSENSDIIEKASQAHCLPEYCSKYIQTAEVPRYCEFSIQTSNPELFDVSNDDISPLPSSECTSTVAPPDSTMDRSPSFYSYTTNCSSDLTTQTSSSATNAVPRQPAGCSFFEECNCPCNQSPQTISKSTSTHPQTKSPIHTTCASTQVKPTKCACTQIQLKKCACTQIESKKCTCTQMESKKCACTQIEFNKCTCTQIRSKICAFTQMEGQKCAQASCKLQTCKSYCKAKKAAQTSTPSRKSAQTSMDEKEHSSTLSIIDKSMQTSCNLESESSTESTTSSLKSSTTSCSCTNDTDETTDAQTSWCCENNKVPTQCCQKIDRSTSCCCCLKMPQKVRFLQQVDCPNYSRSSEECSYPKSASQMKLCGPKNCPMLRKAMIDICSQNAYPAKKKHIEMCNPTTCSMLKDAVIDITCKRPRYESTACGTESASKIKGILCCPKSDKFLSKRASTRISGPKCLAMSKCSDCLMLQKACVSIRGEENVEKCEPKSCTALNNLENKRNTNVDNFSGDTAGRKLPSACEIRFSMVKITKFPAYSTFEVLKSSNTTQLKCNATRSSTSIESVFVMKNNIR